MDWSLPSDFNLEHDELRGELYIGGVYVRLFMKNPKAALRRPKEFLEGLLERYVKEIGEHCTCLPQSSMLSEQRGSCCPNIPSTWPMGSVSLVK